MQELEPSSAGTASQARCKIQEESGRDWFGALWGGFGLWHCDPVLLCWGSELPVSCIAWEEMSLLFQASHPVFAKQEHVWDLMVLGSVSLLNAAAFLERAAPPLPVS